MIQCHSSGWLNLCIFDGKLEGGSPFPLLPRLCGGVSGVLLLGLDVEAVCQIVVSPPWVGNKFRTIMS